MSPNTLIHTWSNNEQVKPTVISTTQVLEFETKGTILLNDFDIIWHIFHGRQSITISNLLYNKDQRK